MARSTSRRPNVVIFMMDTQGARNMSCYGYRLPTTPHVDRLAKEGALFLNHFVTAPWTLPTHASLFTGRYESGHGAGAQHEGLEAGLPQMPEIFARNGYRTVSLCNNHWAMDDSAVSAGVGFQDFIRYGRADVEPMAPFIPGDDPEQKDKGSLKAVGVALSWIDQNAGQAPFMMYVNCLEPHDPYHPPEPWRSRFLPEGVKYDAHKLSPRAMQMTATVGDMTPTLDQWHVKQMLYAASTACLDDRIGKFADALRERGVLDDTIFIVTGDHGDVIGEQVGYAMHSQNGVWDHVCKTPLVIRYPKVFKPGVKCRELVQINDVFPTLMEICGVKDAAASASIQGHSLLKALAGPTREFALLEAQRGIHPMRRGWMESANAEDLDVRWMNVWYKAARTKRFKYVWVSNGEDLLFDTVADPDERWNLIARRPEVARKLRAALEAKLMSMEQRYYPDWSKHAGDWSKNMPRPVRRLTAWGLYQPEGPIAPWKD